MNNIIAKFRKVEGAVLGILMILMSMLYVFNIAVRELATKYAAHFDWIEEATLFLLAWLVFLGLGITFDRSRHIAMNALLGKFSGVSKRIIGGIIDLTGVAFFLFVAKLGWNITAFVAQSGQISPTLNVSMAWLYLPMPFGFALLALRYGLNLVGITNRHKNITQKEV